MASEDGPGNTTADSGGGPGDSASQYMGGFGGAPNDDPGQTWDSTTGPFSGDSAAQYSNPLNAQVVNRSGRYQSEAQE